MRKKILLVFGTRPEAIKMASVYHALKENINFDISVAVTGQHREMLDQVLSLFEISPAYDLKLMKPNQSLHELTATALLGISNILSESKPDMVLVHGDTSTTFTASLAAFYQSIPVGHVEAGLRTFNLQSPWPEEFNRRATALTTNLHFAPTNLTAENLVSEGIDRNLVFVTGNTVIDSLLHVRDLLHSEPHLSQVLDQKFKVNPEKKLILVTCHRRENHGYGFANICDAIRNIAKRGDVQIVFPVHLNPSISNIVSSELGNISNISLIKPQGYLEFIYLMTRAYLILSDSGGVQEEAPSLDVPVLVMRDHTERPEALSSGAIRLVGTDPIKIQTHAVEILDDQMKHRAMAEAQNPYGDGKASLRIVDAIYNFFENKK